MITKKKLSIYKKYMGDIDAWARLALKEEKNIMKDDDWYLIDSMVQDVILARDSLSSFIKENVDSEDVKAEIINIAKGNFSNE
ncbi:MAG: hypothetical protein R6U66_03440 [Bacteroidales bacterium]